MEPRRVLDARWDDPSPGRLGPEPEAVLEIVGKLLAETRGFSIDALPGIDVDSLDFGDKLPVSTPAVYYLVHECKGVLYIGKATNIRSRWAFRRNTVGGDVPMQIHHRLEEAIRLGNVRLYWWAVPRECLVILENLLIQRHRPPWNIARG